VATRFATMQCFSSTLGQWISLIFRIKFVPFYGMYLIKESKVKNTKFVLLLHVSKLKILTWDSGRMTLEWQNHSFGELH